MAKRQAESRSRTKGRKSSLSARGSKHPRHAPPRANRVFVALGSNIDPERNLPAAVTLLGKVTKILGVSKTYESAPVGYAEQANFCNGAVLLETTRSAESLKRGVLKAIEDQLGRLRDPTNKNGPRTIDLDIALFNDETIDCCGQPIPDPEIEHRPFLAIPLAELAPEFRHPVTGHCLSEIASHFSLDGLRCRADIDLNSALASEAVESRRETAAH